ncbi:MAG TPA: hypothetical protein VGF59_25235 [Bryobacteraceae bacterium]
MEIQDGALLSVVVGGQRRLVFVQFVRPFCQSSHHPAVEAGEGFGHAVHSAVQAIHPAVDAFQSAFELFANLGEIHGSSCDNSLFDSKKIAAHPPFDGAKISAQSFFDGAKVSAQSFFDSKKIAAHSSFDSAKVSAQSFFDGAKVSAQAFFDSPKASGSCGSNALLGGNGLFSNQSS